MKTQKISNRNFERNSKRFKNLSLSNIDSWSDDKAFKDRYDSEANYHVKKMIENLVLNYKKHPFKKKSSYTHKIDCFSKCDDTDIKRYIRLSYVISDNDLTFKLLTKNTYRFKRKVKFVIKF